MSFLTLWLLLAGAGVAEAPLHLRVSWTADPATTATLSWSTREPGETHSAKLRPLGGDAWQEVACQRSGKFTGKGKDLFYHHARLTDLQPDQQYEVIAQSDGDATDTYWFQTAPAVDAPFQLLFGGDSRSSVEHRRKINNLMKRLTTEARRSGGPPVLALAHGGDYVVHGQNIDLWAQWMGDHLLSASDDGQLLPIIPARGNHDVGEGFNEVFDFPAGDKNYYGITLCSVLRLVTLNTETSTAGDQQHWLDRELKATRPRHRWLLCQYHKPAFPAVKVPSGAYGSWVPLFEKHNVDMCLEADGHCIKRTPAIRGDKFDPTGVVYIGEGGLGVGQRSPKDNRWYLQPPAVTGRGHHVHLLTFDGKRLTGRVIREEGSTFDEFDLKARGANALVDHELDPDKVNPASKAAPAETVPPLPATSTRQAAEPASTP